MQSGKVYTTATAAVAPAPKSLRIAGAMSNPKKPKRRAARRSTGAKDKTEIDGDGNGLHEPPIRADAVDNAAAAEITPSALDVAHRVGHDRAERRERAAGGDRFGLNENSPPAPGARTPSGALRTTPSEMGDEARSPSAYGDSPREVVAAVESAPTQAESCRWASLTPSPPPRPAPGLKRLLEDDTDDEAAAVPAAKHRRVTNDPPAESSQLDPTRAGAHVESPAAATHEDESLETTVAFAAVEHFKDADEQPDANDEEPPLRSDSGSPSTPFRPRRSTRARQSNVPRAQSVEAVSIHTAPRRVQPVPRGSAVAPQTDAGKEKDDLVVLVARFHAHLDRLRDAGGRGAG